MKDREEKVCVTYRRQSFLRNIAYIYFENSSLINFILAILIGIILFYYYSQALVSLAEYPEASKKIGEVNAVWLCLFIKFILLFEFVFIPFVFLEVFLVAARRVLYIWQHFGRPKD